MPTVFITTDTDQSVKANAANTTYVVNQYVDLVPADPAAASIDATADVANRTFQIAGHLGGYRGIQVGDYKEMVGETHVIIGTTALVDTGYLGVAFNSDNGSIINDGMIKNGIHGIIAHGNNLTVTNGGTITAQISAVEFGGKDAVMWNTGTISADNDAVYMHGTAKQTITLHNTGTMDGGVDGAAASDIVYNSGKLTGDVWLGSGNDRYEGKGGTVDGTIDGAGGNDVLRGGAGIEILSGGIGHDVLTGRGSADTFIFSTGFDADTITDFQLLGAHDVVDLSEMKGFDSFADLNHHLHQMGKDAVIDFGHGDELTLRNVDIHDLTANDFLF